MHYQLVSLPFNFYCVWHSSNCLSPGFKRRVENIVCIRALNSCLDATVFELAAVCLLSEPFSAVPTFHHCCNTHTRSFTSPCYSLIPFPALLKKQERCCAQCHCNQLASQQERDQ